MGEKEIDQKTPDIKIQALLPTEESSSNWLLEAPSALPEFLHRRASLRQPCIRALRGSNCARKARPNRRDDDCFSSSRWAPSMSVSASTPDLRTAEGFMQIKKRYADAGITVWNIGNTSVHNMPEVTLNLPGRDQKIEEYKQYLRNLGQAGIYYTTYAHMGNGIWSSGRADHSRRVRPRIRYGEPQQGGRLGRQKVP